ncbi:MAG: nucleoside-diphosphate kinase [bacterium]|nr:nucleoside-diphosphate kinase [bacterium]
MRTGNMGEIIQRLEKHGFRIIALKMLRLSRDEAENFYYTHRNTPYFSLLIDFMCSDQCVTMVLEGENVITEIREFIGVTDPAKAKPGSIRADFGKSVRENAVHASDGTEASRFEVNYFFPELAW